MAVHELEQAIGRLRNALTRKALGIGQVWVPVRASEGEGPFARAKSVTLSGEDDEDAKERKCEWKDENIGPF